MQDLGLSHLWTQGDFVMRATAIILLIMSLASWIVILTKAWDLVRLKKMAHGAEKRFWHSDDFDHALETLGAANPTRSARWPSPARKPPSTIAPASRNCTT